MKAILLKGPKQLEAVEMTRPEVGNRQARIKVRNVGVCGSDYSSIAGKLPFTRYPVVPGHEASGEIAEIGSHPGWKPGDRVLIHPILGDRSDPIFQRGEVHHSDSMEVLGVVSQVPDNKSNGGEGGIRTHETGESLLAESWGTGCLFCPILCFWRFLVFRLLCSRLCRGFGGFESDCLSLLGVKRFRASPPSPTAYFSEESYYRRIVHDRHPTMTLTANVSQIPA